MLESANLPAVVLFLKFFACNLERKLSFEQQVHVMDHFKE